MARQTKGQIEMSKQQEQINKIVKVLSDHHAPVDHGKNIGQYRIELECVCGGKIIVNTTEQGCDDAFELHKAAKINKLLIEAEIKSLKHWLTEMNLDTETGLDRLKKRLNTLQAKLSNSEGSDL